CLDLTVLGHVFYRYGDLAQAIPAGRKALELAVALAETQDPRARPILVLAVDVLIFVRIETGEIPLAMQGLDQALVQLAELDAQGFDVSSALTFHRKLRAAFLAMSAGKRFSCQETADSKRCTCLALNSSIKRRRGERPGPVRSTAGRRDRSSVPKYQPFRSWRAMTMRWIWLVPS